MALRFTAMVRKCRKAASETRTPATKRIQLRALEAEEEGFETLGTAKRYNRFFEDRALSTTQAPLRHFGTSMDSFTKSPGVSWKNSLSTSPHSAAQDRPR